MNKQRQIVLALHDFAATNNGRMPTIGDELDPRSTPKLAYPHIRHPSLFTRLLPYVDQESIFRDKSNGPVALFISPADPSIDGAKNTGFCSYAGNGRVFTENPRMPNTFGDGSANTIAFAEHYAVCRRRTFHYWEATGFSSARPAFADRGDVVPVTAGLPPISTPSIGNALTFQAAPALNDCAATLAQTPHANGMIVAMGDGSVRVLSPGISVSTYWALVTPRGGELTMDWW
jgi:prepilin-type processing-associated H-X9-DG protein